MRLSYYEQLLRQQQAARAWLRDCIAKMQEQGYRYNAELGCWQHPDGSEIWVEG